MGLYQKAILMRVAKDRLVDAIATFLLSVRNLEPKGRFRDAIDLSNKVSTLIVKKVLAVGDQELQVTNLW